MSGALAHRTDGAGEPVLLLNGGMMTIASWEPVARALAAEYRVIRCDLRGQLLSPGEPEPGLAAHVDDVVALLDHLRIDAAHAIGTSFGAQLALLLAATRPGRVRSVVAAAAVDRPSAAMLTWGRDMIMACRHALETGDRARFWDVMLPPVYSPAFLAANREALRARRDVFSATPLGYFSGGIRLLEAAERMDLRPHLGAIRCPVLVIAAGADALMPLERSRALADGIAGARLEVVPGAGHALVVESTARLIELCQDFLAQSTDHRGRTA